MNLLQEIDKKAASRETVGISKAVLKAIIAMSVDTV
jgi:hypothetical protein